MITLEQARDAIVGALAPLPAESVPLTAALRRVTADDLHAACDVPPFDNAAVDGYAVRAADLARASASTPVRLRLCGTSAAGDAPEFPVEEGCCSRIFTGAPLPAGADAVVMQEDVRPGTDHVEFLSSAAPWEGIRLRGGDLRRGDLMIPAGERLRPAHIGLLASTGIAEVPVHRLPRVLLLVTGSELTPAGQPLAPGRIYDSNRPLLTALAAAEGLTLADTMHAPDTLDGTRDAIRRAAAAAEVLITTGGVSVGDADFVRTAMEALGGGVELWRIAIKPGKPFAWGRLGGAVWFGLPGNPVSAFVTWHVLVRPALRRLMGMRQTLGRRIRARLGERISNPGDRRHFLRVQLDGDGCVRLAGVQASHVQSAMAAADALLDCPPGTRWNAGQEVEIELLGD